MFTVFTRKNLIFLALIAIFSFVAMYVGCCVDAAHTIFPEKNIINMLANGLNMQPIEAKIGGYICLMLVAIYFFIFALAFTYARRSASIAGKKPFSLKMIGIYVAIALGCILLSWGLGIVIQKPLNGENIVRVLTFVGQTLGIALLVYVIGFAAIGSVVMLVVNFVKVGKPFKFFNKEDEPVFDDDDIRDMDVASSFGSDENANVNSNNQNNNANIQGGVAGVGGALSDGTGEVIAHSTGLEEREKVFPELSKIDVKFEAFDAKPLVSDDISLDQLCSQFRQYLSKKEHLYYDIDTIRFFVSGFAASHFEILEGLSGTGKSSLPRYFAHFVNGKVLFMPVQATWRDKSNILGFFNEFSKVYSETELLASLYEANYNSDEINIYVLDEMNISRVEYYFADLLSVLEYPVPEWRIKIVSLPNDFLPPLKLVDGYINIPENSYFVGTANKDDSTFTITDKVYDRAITIDFDEYNEPFEVEEDVSPINLSGSGLRALYSEALKNTDNCMNSEDMNKISSILDYVYETFSLTVGNRILNQIKNIVPVFVACGGTKETALDLMLCRKLFAKLEGRFEDYVKPALKDTLALLDKTYGKDVMAHSKKIINKLIKAL